MPQMPDAMRGVNFLAAGATSVQRCASCGNITSELDGSAECANCGGLYEIVHAIPDAHGAALLSRFAGRCCTHPAKLGIEQSGVWRFREL